MLFNSVFTLITFYYLFSFLIIITETISCVSLISIEYFFIQLIRHTFNLLMYFLVLFFNHTFRHNPKDGSRRLTSWGESIEVCCQRKRWYYDIVYILYAQFSKMTFLGNNFKWAQLHIQSYWSLQYLDIKIDRHVEQDGYMHSQVLAS